MNSGYGQVQQQQPMGGFQQGYNQMPGQSFGQQGPGQPQMQRPGAPVNIPTNGMNQFQQAPRGLPQQPQQMQQMQQPQQMQQMQQPQQMQHMQQMGMVQQQQQNPGLREKIVEVPEIEYVQKIVEVPEIVYQTRVIEQIKVELQERIIPVPKEVIHEKIVEVPEVEYRDIMVEKIVEVPEIQEQFVMKEVEVPQIVEVAVPEYQTVQVNQEVSRQIPVAVEVTATYEYKMPRIKPRYTEIPVPIYVPRFIEVPVPAQMMDENTTYEANQLNSKVAALSHRGSANISELRELVKM